MGVEAERVREVGEIVPAQRSEVFDDAHRRVLHASAASPQAVKQSVLLERQQHEQEVVGMHDVDAHAVADLFREVLKIFCDYEFAVCMHRRRQHMMVVGVWQTKGCLQCLKTKYEIFLNLLSILAIVFSSNLNASSSVWLRLNVRNTSSRTTSDQ